MKNSRSHSIRTIAVCGLAVVAFGTMGLVAALGSPSRDTSPGAAPAADPVKRGEYLVTIGGCNDCHTPWKMGEKGPEPDMSRMLSGHPEALVVHAAPTPGEGPWLVAAAATNTAWAGPWGVSFTANLTPDRDTGLGAWSEEIFINTMRTGKHWGQSRPLLPPMPWFNYGKMSDEDLKAVFAYLRSIPPVRNAVPLPIPPGGHVEVAENVWN